MLRDSVRQGLPEAMLRLAQYYDNSTILVLIKKSPYDYLLPHQNW